MHHLKRLGAGGGGRARRPASRDAAAAATAVEGRDPALSGASVRGRSGTKADERGGVGRADLPPPPGVRDPWLRAPFSPIPAPRPSSHTQSGPAGDPPFPVQAAAPSSSSASSPSQRPPRICPGASGHRRPAGRPRARGGQAPAPPGPGSPRPARPRPASAPRAAPLRTLGPARLPRTRGTRHPRPSTGSVTHRAGWSGSRREGGLSTPPAPGHHRRRRARCRSLLGGRSPATPRVRSAGGGPSGAHPAPEVPKAASSPAGSQIFAEHPRGS
ncbi:unnamed protein product [Rangifer tarandus platyrhynchus]|uniref:Basic proline-rich protein-like n=3 Tax=Rangifer tarandus platyrhynchus TaxID=3082113 RepID=A0ABN8ZEN9_RANTA|nr:unnamed protein product [Rangifer tarandus platyrhynchus]CAI9707480.1 unnamed protein product [Rangifer tarandus platyrhynchus]